MTPFNPTKHAELLEQGYTYTHYEADWHDAGDAENGPHLEGGPAWDEYCNATERVVIEENGQVAFAESIDPEFEAFLATQQERSQ